MKITFITSTSFLDTALPLIDKLCKKIEINVVINFSEHNKRTSIVNINKVFKKNTIISENEKIFDLLKDTFSLFNNLENVNFTLVYWCSLKQLQLKNILFSLKLREFVNSDLIINQIQNMHYYFLIKYIMQKPVVMDIHDPIEHSGQKIGFGLKMFLKKWSKYSNQIIIHNKNDIYDFSKKYTIDRAKINYIGFGTIPINIYNINPISKNAQNNNILFFGRISPYKGLEYLIDAVRIARKKISDIKLIVAGSGKFYFDISSLKNDPTFEIINRYIPNEELAKLIQKCSLVVCPYTDATQSGVIMTAYAFNKPVVASAVGGIPEVVEDNVTGKLVPPKDPKALAEAIIKLLKDKGKLIQIGENIKVKCSEGEFSWDYIADKTIEVYKKALQNK